MKTHIVVDLMFGDSGKGLTVDWLCSKSKNPIVVRYNGGQNAGHTVIIDRTKHVHSNFGSGTLRGCPSYFTEHTSFYLNTMANEKAKLKELGIDPKLFIHPMALVTTPFDVAYNRAIENHRSQDRLLERHGSVGLGIAATQKRNYETPYRMYAIDLKYPKIALQKLKAIEIYYDTIVPGMLYSDYHHEAVDQLAWFKDLIVQESMFETVDYDLFDKYSDIIFEGAQGILLDMDHGFFPNVTYGNTTSKNAMAIIEEIGLDIPDIYYITRCYQTRHGNGWMSNEDKIELVHNAEEINVPNEWQGKFRTGELDYDLLNYALQVDAIYSYGYKNLVVSCMDQRPSFLFDYNRLSCTFDHLYESASPDSKYLTDMTESLQYNKTKQHGSKHSFHSHRGLHGKGV